MTLVQSTISIGKKADLFLDELGPMMGGTEMTPSITNCWHFIPLGIN